MLLGVFAAVSGAGSSDAVPSGVAAPGAGSSDARPDTVAAELTPRFSRIYLWVIRDALEDTLRLAVLADSARAAGITDLLIQIRGRGEAYYRSSTEPAPPALETTPPAGFKYGDRPSEACLRYDPLAAAIRIARARGLKIHAWFNVFLAGRWKGNGGRNVVVRKPDWRTCLADGRSLEELSAAERRRAGVEGIYLSPGNPEVLPYLEGVVLEFLRRYELDGLHLDYIRYPYADAGYDEPSRRAYLIDDLAGNLPAATDHQTDPWDLWRIEQVSRTVERLSGAARAVAPGVEITAAVIPNPSVARGACMQDWPRWIPEGWIDAALLMAYTGSPDRLEGWLRKGAEEAGSAKAVVPGLGLHKLDGRGTYEIFERARTAGTGTLALFSNVEFMRSARVRGILRGMNGGGGGTIGR